MTGVPRYSPRSQCEGKRRWRRSADAKRYARRIESLPNNDGETVGRMRPYRCPHCGHWHLGHKPAKGGIMDEIPIEYVNHTCRLGQGAACCSYLAMGPGFTCLKGTALQATIDERRESGAIGAMGDNCPGWRAVQS